MRQEKSSHHVNLSYVQSHLRMLQLARILGIIQGSNIFYIYTFNITFYVDFILFLERRFHFVIVA